MEKLPEEILFLILSNLSPYKEQEIASKVCKSWANVINILTKNREKYYEKNLKKGEVQWYELKNDSKIKIQPRQEVSMCYNDLSCAVYIFGGISACNTFQGHVETGFNDLLTLNMNTYEWDRPPIKGKPPNPLRRGELLSYKDKLFLYSGVRLAEPTPFNTTESRINNQLFTYQVTTGFWSQVDYLEEDCPPPMIVVCTCIKEFDTDLGMDAFYVLGNRSADQPKELWELDLQSYTWEKQIIEFGSDRLPMLLSCGWCKIFEIKSKMYSSALLVISVFDRDNFDIQACLLLKIDYKRWKCEKISIPSLPKQQALFFKKKSSLLSLVKVKDTLVFVTSRPSTADLLNCHCTVKSPKKLNKNNSKQPSSIHSIKTPIVPISLGPEFLPEFVTVFLLDTSEVSKKDSKQSKISFNWLKFEDKENNVIKPSLTCKCCIKHGTLIHGRGELILLGEPRTRNTKCFPVYILRNKYLY